MLEYPENEICTAEHRHDAAVRLAEGHMPQPEKLEEMAELFKVFGDSTRIRILYLLSESELCVCDVAALLGLTQPAMSYQLKTLKRFRLVKSRKEGKTVFYSLADKHVATIIGMAKEHLEEK